MQIYKEPEPFKRLPALAERLGVAPLAESRPDTVTLDMGSTDGRQYDLFELIEAFLDRLDAAASGKHDSTHR